MKNVERRKLRPFLKVATILFVLVAFILGLYFECLWMNLENNGATYYGTALHVRIATLIFLIVLIFIKSHAILKRIALVATFIVFVLQFQYIQTTSLSTPPSASTNAIGLFVFSEVALCVESSADDLFEDESKNIVSNLKVLKTSSVECDVPKKLNYIRVTKLIDFVNIDKTLLNRRARFIKNIFTRHK